MNSPADVVELVVLLDEDGLAVGISPKATVHHTDTPLHLAFSCYLFDRHGQRVCAEVGVRADGARLLVPRFRYRAVMPDGVVENEMCPLLVATSADPPAPDPDEVDEARWVDWAEFRAGVLSGSREISPECREQVEQLPEDPLAAEPQPCLALPPALRRWR
jgi:isopentenyl-diphosphate delta-isomerase